jgi:predicted dithiol-disulfide oxidoreductase (DUF899 family)
VISQTLQRKSKGDEAMKAIQTPMPSHTVVSSEEWLEARKAHLAKEKEFTRLRDQLSAERRNLPRFENCTNDLQTWVIFYGPQGREQADESA